MKFDNFFVRLLGSVLIAGSVLCFTACSDDDDPEPTGTFKLAKNTVKVGFEGGSYSVGYTPAGAEISATSADAWVHDFTAATGKLSFTVDANDGDKRSTTVTVTCAGEDYPFTVEQEAWIDPTKVTMADLDGKYYGATICQFYDETQFWQTREPNGSGGFVWDFDTESYVVISARQFAEEYAAAHNELYPDDPMTVEDAMSFGFVDEGTSGSYGEFGFKDNYAQFHMGYWAPGGQTNVEEFFGAFVFDEETGILTIEDQSNKYEQYWRTIKLKLTKQDGQIVIDPVEWPEPALTNPIDEEGNPVQGYDFEGPQFGFTLNNYDGTKGYVVGGKMTYYVEEIEIPRQEM